MVYVDEEKCISCGTYESICLEVFEAEEVAEVKDPTAPCVEDTAQACPTDAIIEGDEKKTEKDKELKMEGNKGDERDESRSKI